MNCINCYQEIPDDTNFCPYCGAKQSGYPAQSGMSPDNQQTYSEGPGEMPHPSEAPGQEGEGRTYQAPPVYQQPYQSGVQEKTVNWVPYLILSIISTLCCCLPLGIAGIVYSAKISSMTTAGNTEEARKAAKTATIWIIAAFAVGVVLDICAFLLILTEAVTDGYYGGIFDVIRELTY